jgi:hypothetical protein
MFEIEMLPADEGDCLLLRYGEGQETHRVLIDCGTTATMSRLRARLHALGPDERRFDLFVLTHIDSDHIGGAIEFLKHDALGLEFEDIWFNGWRHLPKRRLGARQGEIFSTLLRDKGLPWNRWTDREAVVLDGSRLPTRTLPGGMEITLLSPTRKMLELLAVTWQKELRKHGFTPGSRTQFRKFLGGSAPTAGNLDDLADSRFRGDTSRPNGSSIGFLAEYGGKSALLAGDAHAPVLEEAIRSLVADRGGRKLRLDAFKLPHHGSRGNLSRELVELVSCRKWLVSTNGHKFHHPDGEALAKIVRYGGRRRAIHFNYRTKYNAFWGGAKIQKDRGYKAHYPPAGQEGLVVRL